jgi:uncharacterized glyoxalase superfamily protein PhnB
MTGVEPELWVGRAAGAVAVYEAAVTAGATLASPVGEEHEWRVGRIVDPFGHEWEIGRPG